MTVLDIGANIGCHTLRFAKLVGPEGRVIAFEPMEWAFSKLKRNVELNNFSIILEKAGLSNETKTEQICFKSSWPVDHKPIPEAQMENLVQLTTLDDYLKGKQFKNIDMIKIDVDGYEFKVLRGAAETLKTYKPVIIMEAVARTLKRWKGGGNIEDMLLYVQGFGYKLFSVKDFKMFPDIHSFINVSAELKNVILSVNDL